MAPVSLLARFKSLYSGRGMSSTHLSQALLTCTDEPVLSVNMAAVASVCETSKEACKY